MTHFYLPNDPKTSTSQHNPFPFYLNFKIFSKTSFTKNFKKNTLLKKLSSVKGRKRKSFYNKSFSPSAKMAAQHENHFSHLVHPQKEISRHTQHFPRRAEQREREKERKILHCFE